MSRAEEAANKYSFESCSPFPNTEKAAVIYGYEQAEKDLTLTWEDIEEILIIDAELWEEIREQKGLIATKEYYGEVLRRFNEYKSKKNESE